MTDREALERAGKRDYAEVWDELEDASGQFADVRPRKDRQLNLRVDADLLAALRTASAQAGEGYHSFARRLVEEGVARALEAEPAEPSAAAKPATPSRRPFQVKEVLLVLLSQPGASDQDNEPIVGKTRLQKLLFLAAQHLKGEVAARFEAYSYGPFEEEVEPDLEFLASEGLVEWEGRGPEIPQIEGESERGAKILDWVRSRGETKPRPIESYRLTQLGLEWVRRFFASDAFGSAEAKKRLADECQRLKERFGRVPLDDLVEFVYAEFPEFTKQSKIRHEVAERRARKAARSHGTQTR
jgi:predicted DNA binding CopG/RHH family protein